MPDDQKNIIPINYTHREFKSIRQDLLQIAERLYPDSFQDFSEASFGSLMLDAVAYVGDQLSFYLDYNVNEAFLDTAYQYSNIIRHGRTLGYKDTGRPSTYGEVALFVQVPASGYGIGPDTKYLPVLKRGSRFTSVNGLSYVLVEDIDMSSPKNPVIVSQVDSDTGAPTNYAVKAYGTVVSGYYGEEKVKIGPYERFKRVRLATANISEVTSVFDSEGHEYFEVDYLSQDMVYKEITNTNYQNDNVPSILKPYLVSRKFVVEKDRFSTDLQFGSGKAGESDVIANPQSVALDIFGKNYVTDTTFDPTRLTKNENFGIVPSNTTLTIAYRVTNPGDSNAAVGAINSVSNVSVEFKDANALTPTTMRSVIASVEVNNEVPIIGNVSTPTSTELKRRVYDTFPTQNRAVTQADYENLSYRMPAKFGSIKRVSVQKDPDSQKRNLNLYVISEDEFGKLVKTNRTIKNNLKTWLNSHRMINDTIDILDPYILNLGIEFVVKPAHDADKYVLLDQCVSMLKTEFANTSFYIGEAVYISNIFAALKKVPGVLDVLKAKLVTRFGSGYSDAQIIINNSLAPDGSYLIVPKNAIVEFKYPSVDIKGKIR